MKRFIAQLNDGSYINIAADKMELAENNLLVYAAGKLVAYVDCSVVLTAHLNETSTRQ